MSSFIETNDNSNWIAPWSKAVHKAAEEEKRIERRRSSFATMNKSIGGINEFRSSINNVFQFAEKLPSPPVLERVFFSPHPDDIAYSHYGTASSYNTNKKPRCCHHDKEEQQSFETFTTKVNKKFSFPSLRVQREDSGVGLLSPSLSSSSKFSDEATLVATPSSFSSASSSTSASSTSDSRRNSVNNTNNDQQSNENGIESQNALIVTVFSKSRCANGEIGSRLNRNVDDTTTLRTYEDEEFARSIGCDLLQLGFPDSSARDEPSRRPDLAELAMKQEPGHKINSVDHYIFEDVRKSLEPIVWMAIRAGAKIHLPLGVGCHVDHWMVRVAVLSILDEIQENLSNPILLKKMMENESLEKLFLSTNLINNDKLNSIHERLIFYEDLPYADAQTNSHVESLAKSVLPIGTKAKLIHLTEKDWCKKRAAVLAYASQMKPTILPSLYNHATRLAQLGNLIDPEFDTSKPHLAAERIWIVDAKLRRKALLLLEEQQQQ